MTTTLPDPENDPNSLGSRLTAKRRENPGSPVLLTGRDLHASPGLESAANALLQRLAADASGPVALTVLSNAVIDLNPFAGLSTAESGEVENGLAEGLVSLLAPGEVVEWHAWPEHFVLLCADAAEALDSRNLEPVNALQRLREAGGRLLVADSLFLRDPGKELFGREELEPHESRRPPSWGLLRRRLDDCLRHLPADGRPAWAKALSDFQRGRKPVTLHITHSWGGGVARWVESFIDADDNGLNLQLRSVEDQSGKGYGQRFSLYLGNQLDAPIASWWLQPPIQSTVSRHGRYKDMLHGVIRRYGVGRLLLSSLVGHSLDALDTGLPTLQVLHDFYPLWPLLGIHPEPYLEEGPENRLDAALAEHALLPGFRSRSAHGWKSLGRQWRERVVHRGVRLAAPSLSVASLLRRLDPAWSDIDIEIIPHGLPALPGTARPEAREREDGRLRLVVPGRIQEGKGRRLLLDALPKLREIAQVYLLGAGKDGEEFFGRSGVNVITQYDRSELRDFLVTIGPHAACLLSVVPETFSYTLSEMHHLGIPVIATRVGSLEERIEDGVTGWLIDADAESLLERVRALAANREVLPAIRENLADPDIGGPGRMVSRYDEYCRPQVAERSVSRMQTLDEAQAGGLAFEGTELRARNRELVRKNRELQAEVELRSEWAEERDRVRKEEVERRIRWVAELEESLEHERTTNRVKFENLQSVHEWVLGTASWRFTRPFRVLGRLAGTLSRARAWNPLRWPLLLSQAVRTVSTHGLAGALARSQFTHTETQRPERGELFSVESVGDPEAPASFPETEEPEVSIVIPVYNKWAYSAACLRSLSDTPCKIPFEIIVVDDCSSDETADRLKDIGGIVHLRNERNQGFIRSCNRGAASAKGRYTVFLNNDTQVLEGWLEALAETFRRHGDTGLAGARLVYPDGKLQEAGGIIFRDGSGWNYGRGDDAERSEYQYLREADYCSGACIMLETGLFRELGGFDERYAPAYYEDTDLAFRVRANGLKVRIQPAAVVVHHEGISSGTDISEGTKRYQAVNREKFRNRWSSELAAYPEPIADPDDGGKIRAARDHRLAGRILLIDAHTPEPDQDSGSVRLSYLMDCLIELGYGVTFMADNRAHAGRYTTALQQSGVEVVYQPWAESSRSFLRERGADFDFVLVSRHYVAAHYVSLFRRYCPQAKFIFDTVDLHYLREERLAELENSTALRTSAAVTRRSELAVINAADATLVVSPVEKAVLEQAAPEARVHVISNIHEVRGSARPYGERKDIFFVGGYQHPPNTDAALWFVGSIWPLIRKELPDIEFHLIGSKAPEEIRALDGDGVRFHGFVHSLDPWLDGCRMSVAPLRYGAGIKGKVNQSMSRGQPVVATPMAVEGMFAESGRDVLVAETPEEFAAQVVRLYSDETLWNRVSEAGMENVRQYFSVETARHGLRELLDSLC